MSQLLNINILEMQNSLITYNNFKELLAQFIFKNCKNIDTIKNDIPIHYDNDKNILYSFLCPSEEDKVKKPNYQISLLTISYSKYNNKFKKIDSDIIRKNIDNLFIVNNLTDYNTHVSYINIFKCCIVMVAFLKAKVLRTYFPLTNSYCYFYDGTSTLNDAPINISAKFGLNNNDNIEELFELLLTYMTGCTKIEDKYIKSNLFYSFLYNVNSRTIKPDELNSLSAISINNINNPDIDNSGYNLINKDFQITIS